MPDRARTPFVSALSPRQIPSQPTSLRRMKTRLAPLGLALLLAGAATGRADEERAMSNQTAAEFRFPGKRIEGVMGNGRLVATLWPGQLVFRYNPIVAEVRFGTGVRRRNPRI
jgi:hypothetical protein